MDAKGLEPATIAHRCQFRASRSEMGGLDLAVPCVTLLM